MRTALSFLAGVLLAAVVGVGLFILEKSSFNPTTAMPVSQAGIARYQLVHGKVIDAAGQDADIIMRIDTATGQTWECRVELNKGLFWKALTDDPLVNPTQK